MAILDEFAAFCAQHPGKTLSDHLFSWRDTWDPAQLASLKSQMRRALAPGGKYRKLATQKAVVPGPTDRGEWTAGLDVGVNTLPAKVASNAMAPLRAADKSRLTTLYREQVEIAEATNLTGRKGTAVNNALVGGIHAFERQQDKVDAQEEMIEQLRGEIERLSGIVDFQQEIIRKLGGTDGNLPRAAQ